MEEFDVLFRISKNEQTNSDQWEVMDGVEESPSCLVTCADKEKNIWNVFTDEEHIGRFKSLATALGEAVLWVSG